MRQITPYFNQGKFLEILEKEEKNYAAGSHFDKCGASMFLKPVKNQNYDEKQVNSILW